LNNMPAARPVFHDAGQVYHPDTCRPLRQAAEQGTIRLHAIGRGSYPGRKLPAGAAPEVRSIGFWDATADQAWGLDWHCNEGIELTYLARGAVAFSTGDREYPLKPGSLTITRPWQRHRVGNPNVTASRLHWLILDVSVRRPNQPWRWPEWLLCPPSDLKRLTTLLRQNEHPVWSADEQIGECFEKLAQDVQSFTPERGDVWLKLHINELVVALIEMFEHKRVPLDATLSTSQRVVEMFLHDLPRRAGEPWTLDAMARQCGLARTRFAHYCRQITNMSPAEYLTRCRIDAAARLLAEGGRSVTDVALECGFSSSQYFATVFRRITGRAPSETRERRLAAIGRP
jgi:AraC-like DNA-binding protein